MSARTVACVSFAAAATATATVAFGWVGVPVVAAVLGVAAPQLRLRTVWIGVAALIAWGALLAWQAIFAAGGAVAGVLGRLVGVPGIVPVLMTLLLAFVLAWSAGVLGAIAAGLLQALRGPRPQAQ